MSFNQERRQVLAAGLKSARHSSGMSASRAAALLAIKGLACTRGTLLAWERGAGCTSREPFASDLSVLASIYGCAVGDFFRAALPAAPSTDGALATVHSHGAYGRESNGHESNGQAANGYDADGNAESDRWESVAPVARFPR